MSGARKVCSILVGAPEIAKTLYQEVKTTPAIARCWREKTRQHAARNALLALSHCNKQGSPEGHTENSRTNLVHAETVRKLQNCSL